MKLSAAFEASIALSSAMCPMLTNSSRVLRESRTIQIIEPICSTAGSPISITNETMPGFLTTSVSNIMLIDQRKEGEEGPWTNFARMHTLRTPKYLTGPDLGIPSLTPRAWYEAKHGADAWDKLDKIPRETWHEYIGWYRSVLKLPVRNQVRLTRIVPVEDLFQVTLKPTNGVPRRFIIPARWCLRPERRAAGAGRYPY